MLFFFGACCKWRHHFYTTALPLCSILALCCLLSTNLHTMAVTVTNFQDNRSVSKFDCISKVFI